MEHPPPGRQRNVASLLSYLFKFPRFELMAAAVALVSWLQGSHALWVVFFLTLSMLVRSSHYWPTRREYEFEACLSGTAMFFLIASIQGRVHFKHFVMEAGAESAKLFALLTGYFVVGEWVEKSHLGPWLQKSLRGLTRTILVLGILAFGLSPVLDNTATALIIGNMAKSIFMHVDPRFAIAVVHLANAGGAGSPIGDITTIIAKQMGVPTSEITRAFVPSIIFAAMVIPLMLYFQRRHPQMRAVESAGSLNWRMIGAAVITIVTTATATLLWDATWLGLWAGVFAGSHFLRDRFWLYFNPRLFRSCAILSFLVAMAHYLPLEGFWQPGLDTCHKMTGLSALVDNIPVTLVALLQGGYDWGYLLSGVAMGGGFLFWFGCTPGAMMSNLFPTLRQGIYWLLLGWIFIPLWAVAVWLSLLVMPYTPSTWQPPAATSEMHSHQDSAPQLGK